MHTLRFYVEILLGVACVAGVMVSVIGFPVSVVLCLISLIHEIVGWKTIEIDLLRAVASCLFFAVCFVLSTVLLEYAVRESRDA